MKRSYWLATISIMAAMITLRGVHGDEQPSFQHDPLSVEVARDRAQVMHEVYVATLGMLHHRYFHRDRSILPARAMQDIFSEIEQQSNVQARWISASMKPMSIDNAPKSEFEKQAAKQIAAGTELVEVVEDGFYRRAGAIRLGAGCITCHDTTFRDLGRDPKFAGLVISIPLRDDARIETDRGQGQ